MALLKLNIITRVIDPINLEMKDSKKDQRKVNSIVTSVYTSINKISIIEDKKLVVKLLSLMKKDYIQTTELTVFETKIKTLVVNLVHTIFNNAINDTRITWAVYDTTFKNTKPVIKLKSTSAAKCAKNMTNKTGDIYLAVPINEYKSIKILNKTK